MTFSYRLASLAICALALIVFCSGLSAQSITSGDITGTVNDPSGSILANATVTLKNQQTGNTQTAKTTTTGVYRFAFLPPGQYAVSVNAPGFMEAKRVVTVQVGSASTVDVQMALASTTQTVEVSESNVAIQTQNGDISTTFSALQVAELPNAGNDTTAIAYTAPGVVLNTAGGYGNFSTFGLPGTANLFTTNGQNNNDPYLGLNNSGATNLSLGKNDVLEATVINNGYSGQYGQLAGSQVDVVTKSGTNQFHGNAIWNWAGSYLAANDFFANASGTPLNRYNDNQWAGSIGGPIWKNKTFFFFNTEGIRVLLPSAPTQVKIPSQQFQAATIANLTATGQTAAVAFYQKAFALYNSASGLRGGTATPVAGGGCGSGSTAFKLLGDGVPCALSFRQNNSSLTDERVWSLRIDHQIGKNDRIFGRYFDDNGTQATGTDPINAAFNAFSPQPSKQGQLTETHTFSPTAVNQFLFSGFYYSAIFGPPDFAAATAAFPVQLSFTGGFFTTLAPIGGFPAGRIVKQWQYVDDFSKIWGNHSFKTGFNYHKNPYTDIGNQTNNTGTITSSTLQDFYSGGGTKNNLTQVFPTSPSKDFTYNQFGAYVQDEWRATSTLKVTFALRLDHNGNLTCASNCFTTIAPFTTLVHDPKIPFNQVIKTGQSTPNSQIDAVVWEPRASFAWSPKFGKSTVIRGGIGVFGDSTPLVALVPISQNIPSLFSARAVNLPLTPGVAGGLFANAAASNAAFQNAFSSGGTLAQLQAAVPGFAAPRVATSDLPFHTPRYYEWNLEFQQEIGFSTVASVNYVGNHGSKLYVRNFGLNAYCNAACGGFAGLPTAAPDPRFGRILENQSSGVSNYEGLTAGLRRRFSHGFLLNFNYSYGHGLDDISNGGRLPFSANTNVSETAASNPYNIRGSMYGNSDYDVRHNVSANFVWDNSLRHLFKGGPEMAFGGWSISGTVFHRTGLPFSVIDTNVSSGFLNYSGNVFAQNIGHGPTVCGASAVDTPCFGDPNNPTYLTDPTGFNNTGGRNQFRGPNFTNVDLNITKKFKIGEKVTLGIGATAYNLFNHANFDQPVNDLGSGQVGQIISTVGTPTSIFGAFVGSQNSPRAIQFKAQISF